MTRFTDVRPCQRCDELPDRCDCPTFTGPTNFECRRCGALQGQHLIDYTPMSDRFICPGEPGWAI